MYQFCKKTSIILLVLASSAFSLKAMDESYDIENYPLWKTENLRLLYNLANKVSKTADESFPAKKQVLVGMGNHQPIYWK